MSLQPKEGGAFADGKATSSRPRLWCSAGRKMASSVPVVGERRWKTNEDRQ
jgi:hypothetical protein